ncbi:hypothetical protein P7C70_g7096, partial [Phenoliferia sp. Uapishka_3]
LPNPSLLPQTPQNNPYPHYSPPIYASSSSQSSFGSPQTSYQYTHRAQPLPPAGKRKSSLRGDGGVFRKGRTSLLDRLRTPVVFLVLGIVVVAWRLRGGSAGGAGGGGAVGKVIGGESPGLGLKKVAGRVATRLKLPTTKRKSRDSEKKGSRTEKTPHSRGTTEFTLSKSPRPVHHLESLMDYSNHPLSPHRPSSNQFMFDETARTDRPFLTLITATNNPRPVLLETATSIFGQSLQNFQWIIVDDHTTSSSSLALIEEIAKDPRVVVVKNTGEMGLSQGRNVGLNYVFGRAERERPRYLVSVDDDDLFEFTALEKAVWMLESQKGWDLAGFTYDEVNFKKGGEDWDFWMCLASSGHWGGTVPEPLYWYRMNNPAFRSSRWGTTFDDLRSGSSSLPSKIQSKRPKFTHPSTFPSKSPIRSLPLEPITWEAPYSSHLALHQKTIMFILPWLYVGGADIGALHMIQLYAEMGYRVTVVCTLFKFPDGVELRPWVLQWTSDVHVLPSFLRANDFPRYLKHLLVSRGVEEVVISNSQLAYELLPALVEQVPKVKFVDYLHNEAYDGWKSGGYPTYSIISQRYLARTITCSNYLKAWLTTRGHSSSRIGVVKLGIEISDFYPVREKDRSDAKADLFSVEPDTLIVTFVGRMDPQKRPLLLPLILSELLSLAPDQDFLLVMIGDGPLRVDVEKSIEERDLNDFVRILGTVEKPQEYLVATDIFLLPSVSEGISIAVAEAMAMGLPTITANAGALPEQLGMGTETPGGILVNHTMNSLQDAKLYAQEIANLFNDPKLRRRMGKQARENVEGSFDWRETLPGLVGEFEKAENLVGHGGGKPGGELGKMPHPAAYLAVQTVLLEAWETSDVLGGQTSWLRANGVRSVDELAQEDGDGLWTPV